MLVLGRKPGEYVIIDDTIMVKVVRSEEGDLRFFCGSAEKIV